MAKKISLKFSSEIWKEEKEAILQCVKLQLLTFEGRRFSSELAIVERAPQRLLFLPFYFLLPFVPRSPALKFTALPLSPRKSSPGGALMEFVSWQEWGGRRKRNEDNSKYAFHLFDRNGKRIPWRIKRAGISTWRSRGERRRSERRKRLIRKRLRTYKDLSSKEEGCVMGTTLPARRNVQKIFFCLPSFFILFTEVSWTSSPSLGL